MEQWITEEQWSLAQIVGILTKEGMRISKQTIYNYIHADRSGRLLANTRHKGKYNRKPKRFVDPRKPQIYPTEPAFMTDRNETDFSMVTPVYVKKIKTKQN